MPTNPVIISSKQLISSYSVMDNNEVYSRVGFKNNTDPYLSIIQQPTNQIRFRYPTDMKNSHGCLRDQTLKSYPTVKLENYKGPYPFYLRASLFTSNDKPILHVHSFYGKNCLDDGICTKGPFTDCRKEIEFDTLQILCCPKKDLSKRLRNRCEKSLFGSKQNLEKKIKEDDKKIKDSVSSVKILFEAYYKMESEEINICHIFSNKIVDANDVSSKTLRIVRLSRPSSPKKGGVEIIMLCDKVDKNNIGIRFFDENKNGTVVWEEFVKFEKANVHYQYAIIFNAPPYEGIIEKDVPKKVKLELYRPRENTKSDPFDFEYTPDDEDDMEGLSRKRQKTVHNIEPPCSQEFSVQSSNTVSKGLFPECHPQNFNILTPPNSTSSPNFFGDDDTINDTLENNVPFSEISNMSSLPDWNDTQLQLFCDDFEDDEKSGLILESTNPTLSSVNSPVFGKTNFTSTSASIECESYSLTPLKRMNYEMDCASSKIENKMLLQSSIPEIEDMQNKFLKLNMLETNNSKKEKENKFTRNLELLCTKLSKLQSDQFKSVLDEESGNSVLHLAVIKKDKTEQILPHLLRAINYHAINVKNNAKQTALHIATILNSVAGVELLLNFGADPIITDKEGQTCIHLASKHESATCLKLILQYLKSDTNLDFTDYNGLTALHVAIQWKSEQCFRMLIDASADIMVQDKKSGRNGLHLAILHFPEIVKEILSNSTFDIDAQDFEGNTALHLACINQQYEIASLLMDAEANPIVENFITADDESQTDNKGQTAYDIAADNTKLCQILAGSKNEIQAISSDNQSSKLDSGYISEHEIYHKQLVDNVTLNKLENLLNPPNPSWEILASFAGIDISSVQNVMKLRQEKSHIKVIVHLFEKSGKTTEELLKVLEFADLKEACNVVKIYIDKL